MNATSSPPASRLRAPLSLRAIAELVRLPNVFTALADICLGALASDALPGSWLPVLGLLAASACLYSAGMVWNDYFDLEQDRRERAFRPLPSGRVPRPFAARLGCFLLAGGIFFAALAGWDGTDYSPAPLLIAVGLAAAILLYDAWLKRTWAGPLAMGSCRFLNVLLGLTAGVAWSERPWSLHLAAVTGLYIVGVTWFARTEARMSKKKTLAGAALVILAGLVLALPMPLWLEPGAAWPLFPYLLVGLGFLVGIPVCQAIARPTPSRVQPAVKQALMGLVLLDAILATVFAGPVGLLIALLLLPALYLGRWIYST